MIITKEINDMSVPHTMHKDHDTMAKNSLSSLDLPQSASVDEVADIVIAQAMERFKNRYLMLHGDDETAVDANGRRIVQSWHLFTPKTKKNALDPIARDILKTALDWENQHVHVEEQ